jgi:hypothetical protein
VEEFGTTNPSSGKASGDASATMHENMGTRTRPRTLRHACTQPGEKMRKKKLTLANQSSDWLNCGKDKADSSS